MALPNIPRHDDEFYEAANIRGEQTNLPSDIHRDHLALMLEKTSSETTEPTGHYHSVDGTVTERPINEILVEYDQEKAQQRKKKAVETAAVVGGVVMLIGAWKTIRYRRRKNS